VTDASIDGHHAGLPYHLELLSDPWRTTAWKRAIAANVHPGDVVLDVGTGLGTMAVWAAQAGARRVIAVESAQVVELARQVVADSGVQDVVEVVAGDIATLSPQPVDVILADFVGRLLPDAAMHRAVTAARAWATPQTRWLPRRVSWFTALVGPVAVPALDRWSHPLLGAPLHAVRDQARTVPWTVHLDAQALASAPAQLAALDPTDLPDHLHVQAELSAMSDVVRGAAAWFRADLGQGVILDTGPGRRTFWGQILWAAAPVSVQAGDAFTLQAELRSRPGDVHMSWSLAPPSTARPVPPAQATDASTPDVILPELLADGIPTERQALADVVLALLQRGDPAAHPLLATYQRRFGPHPALQRG